VAAVKELSATDGLAEEIADPESPLYQFFTTTVALITSFAEGKGSNVMACEWTLNVSYEPLRVMSLIGHGDYTHELVSSSGEFGVNLCSAQQAALCNRAGNGTGRDYVKFDDEVFAGRLYQAKKIKAPMVLGCVLNLECVVEQTFPFGEHTAFVGRAIAGRLNRKQAPLLYHQGKYYRLGEAVTKPDAEPAAPTKGTEA